MRPGRPTAAVATALAALLLGACTDADVPTDPPPTRPAAARPTPEPRIDGWPTASPATMGFRSQRLDRLARDAKRLDSSCYAVVRDGRLVGEWNWGTQRSVPREVFSVTKSVTSALVGIALDDGSLALDDPVSRYVPSWRGTASHSVTVRDLLANDSGRFWSAESDYGAMTRAPDRTAYAVGLRQQHPPGTVWAYNNAAIQVLDRVLVRATGLPTAELAARRLFTPLGMTHTRMTSDAGGRSTNAYFGLQTTCLDLARFARLYLEQGTVDGTRILSTAYVGASTGRSSTRLNAAYGYLWWLNREGRLRGATDEVDAAGQPVTDVRGRLVPDAPAGIFSAIGLGGQIAMVDPASRTIVVRLGTAAPGVQPYGLRNAARVVTWALG
ncbi:serine hydrolase domain-containing protein [Nocardioides sp. URHA0020]|uniref:serine hydrolase domain-containing protein n=1 Tax=Nocardioides sp. URHA0020 TaxID=1380392 RepID=UPI000560209C|nr:serine hydrolase domain-containing protein [Nocardioides sp. URHA0020]